MRYTTTTWWQTLHCCQRVDNPLLNLQSSPMFVITVYCAGSGQDWQAPWEMHVNVPSMHTHRPEEAAPVRNEGNQLPSCKPFPFFGQTIAPHAAVCWTAGQAATQT